MAVRSRVRLARFRVFCTRLSLMRFFALLIFGIFHPCTIGLPFGEPAGKYTRNVKREQGISGVYCVAGKAWGGLATEISLGYLQGP